MGDAKNDAENKELVRRYLEDAWNTGDVSACDEIFSPELAAQAKGTIAMFRGAFPDWHCKIEQFIVEGDLVCNRWVGVATHTGDFNGIPATGKPVRLEGISIHRVADGRIVEDWSQADQLGMMQQIGVIQGP